jgi:hypothetical protein
MVEILVKANFKDLPCRLNSKMAVRLSCDNISHRSKDIWQSCLRSGAIIVISSTCSHLVGMGTSQRLINKQGTS